MSKTPTPFDAIFAEKEDKEEVWVRAKHKILCNRMLTPDGTMLESRHRHDYVTHLDANGKEYMLDGGLDYLRSSAHGDEKLLTVYQDDPHEVIRLLVKWGTFGKNGDEPYKQIKIADMSTEHLQACLKTQQATMHPAICKVMENELKYRDGELKTNGWNIAKAVIEVEAANTEETIKQKLIEMGWTPPQDDSEYRNE